MKQESTAGYNPVTLTRQTAPNFYNNHKMLMSHDLQLKSQKHIVCSISPQTGSSTPEKPDRIITIKKVDEKNQRRPKAALTQT